MGRKQYKWRLYADENIEEEVVEELRAGGFDVLSVKEERSFRKQKDDVFHYEKARRLGRYLLTRDEDFWSDTRFPLHESPGVIVLSAGKDASLMVRALRFVLREYGELGLRLDQTKIRLGGEALTIRLIDRDSQKKETMSWRWRDIL